MNRTLIIAFLSLLSHQMSFAQVSLRLYNYRPTGDFGSIMKPANSVELGYMKPFTDDRRLRFNVSCTFLIMKPRLEVFPIYSIENNSKILPGEKSFQKFNIANGFFGIDYAFFKKKSFYMFGGTDLVFGYTTIEYTEKIKTFMDESFSGGAENFGLRFRIGAEVEISKRVRAFVSVNRQYLIITNPADFYFSNDYGIGFCFLLNEE